MYGATAGQVGILRFEAATNQAVCGILPNKHFIPEFLYYLFLLKKEELIATATGNAQPNISQIKIKNMVIPFPPLAEQERIVAILDEAFAAIATATVNVERNLVNAVGCLMLFSSPTLHPMLMTGPVEHLPIDQLAGLLTKWMETTVVTTHGSMSSLAKVYHIFGKLY